MTDLPDDATGPSGDAASWFVRLQSDGAQEADWTAFEAWLSADPANQSAFDAIETLWLDLDPASTAIAAPTPTPTPTTARILPFAKRAERPSWVVWASTGGIAAALAVGVLAPHLFRSAQIAPMQTIMTAKGVGKVVTLGDGTRLELSSATEVNYWSGANGRSAQLIQGEAVFSVTHDPSRPFAVVTGDRRIMDVGTVFDVSRLDHTVRVTVQQGAVAVSAAQTSSSQSTTVNAGQQLIHLDGATDSTVKPVDTDAVLAWRSGRRVYSDAPLEAVVADLNRYFAIPIRVQDRKAGQLRFSGVLVLDSEGAVVDRLQAFMPVAAVRSNGVIWISSRR